MILYKLTGLGFHTSLGRANMGGVGGLNPSCFRITEFGTYPLETKMH